MESTGGKQYSQSNLTVLVRSVCTLLMNKVRLILQNPQKNRQLASNNHLLNLIELISEHLLPQYCDKNKANPQAINLMHNLFYLLAQKVQSVFTSGVIKTCIDQNWDLKGYRSVLIRILTELGVDDVKKLQDFFDKMIQSQNLQSQSCIKALSHFINKPNKSIDEDDLKNPIVSFQTSFQFVKQDIDRFRAQNMKQECFQVLHPWAYDLDQVDFKYVISKDQVQSICQALSQSEDAQVFWLSFFKSQLSASGDEFISALKELCILNDIQPFFDKNFQTYKKFMLSNDFTVSLHQHSQQVIDFISQIQNEAKNHTQYTALTHYYKFKQEPRQRTEYIDESRLKYKIGDNDDMNLVHIDVVQAPASTKGVDMKRSAFDIKPTAQQTQNLFMRFTNVDTEELKDLEIKVNGNQAQFKVGEGDANHYSISNDKKLWESQFMILSKNGQYYIRDLGVVHTSRIKVTNKTQLQLHQGALIDLGKVVHYHINKLTHEHQAPSQQSQPDFIVMRNSHPDYKVDDDALLRARPTWISADENKDLVQNEIMLEANPKQNKFSIGRSNRRDVEIKLKAVSADHCKIEYQNNKGWFIHEREKDRMSSNGTFVFMKSYNQMDDHEPSDIIPLFNGMTISFINYELQVRIEPKPQEELSKSEYEHIDLSADEQHQQQTPREQQMSQRSQPVQQEEIQQQQQQDEVYQEELQATKPKQVQHEMHEEHKQSQRSLHQHEEKQPESQRSLHKDPSASVHQSQHSLHDHSQHHDLASVKDQEQHEEHHERDVYDESPKQIHKKPEEEEPHHEILRSYSKHHIGEQPEGHHHAKAEEPEEVVVQEVHSHEKPQEHEKQEGLPSHRSEKSLKEERKEPVHEEKQEHVDHTHEVKEEHTEEEKKHEEEVEEAVEKAIEEQVAREEVQEAVKHAEEPKQEEVKHVHEEILEEKKEHKEEKKDESQGMVEHHTEKQDEHKDKVEHHEEQKHDIHAKEEHKEDKKVEHEVKPEHQEDTEVDHDLHEEIKNEEIKHEEPKQEEVKHQKEEDKHDEEHKPEEKHEEKKHDQDFHEQKPQEKEEKSHDHDKEEIPVNQKHETPHKEEQKHETPSKDPPIEFHEKPHDVHKEEHQEEKKEEHMLDEHHQE